MKKAILVSIFLVSSAALHAQLYDTTLNTIEVTGNKINQPAAQLNTLDLNRGSGLNLQDAINNVPGVNMQSRTPWGGQHIILRGYYPGMDNGRSNGENFAGLGYRLSINNIPVTDATGTTVMDDIDYSALGRVDIYKGPTPLYGSYIAGAVNLFTPAPASNQTSLQETAIGGSNGLFRTNTSFMTSDGKSDLWVNYGHQTYDGFRPNDGSRKDFLSLASTWHVNKKHTVSSYFSYSHSNEQLAGELDSADFYAGKAISDSNYVLNQSHADIQSFRGGITDKMQIDRHWSNELTLFVTGSKLDQAFAHGYTKAENTSFGGREAVSYEHYGRKTTINGIIGLSFQRTDQNTQGNFILPFILPPFNPTTQKMSFSDVQNYAMNYSLFTEWTFHWRKPKISLVVGTSLNFLEFGTQNLVDSLTKLFLNDPIYVKSFSPNLSPEISLKKTFSKALNAFVTTSAGYAPPSISQMTTSTGAVNTSLKPETAMQYEAGAKGEIGKKGLLFYQAAVYDLNITNRLTSETANGITSYVNVGAQRNIGVELYAACNIVNDKSRQLSLVRPWISYTYTNAVYTDFKNHGKSSKGGDTIVADYTNNKVAAVAPNMLNIGLDIATKSGFYLFGSFRYMDKVPVTFDNTSYMKSYNLLSARIGYKRVFGNHFSTDIFAGADNLLGNTYYSFIFVGQNLQELAQGTDKYMKGGGGDGYILPGNYSATFYGGITLNYKF